MRLLPLLLAVSLACAVQAEEVPQDNSQRYVVDVELQTIDEFQQLLERAEQLLLDGTVSQEDPSEVIFLLHGPVLRNLLRQQGVQTLDFTFQLDDLLGGIRGCSGSRYFLLRDLRDWWLD